MKIKNQKTDISVWLLFIAASVIVLFFLWYFFIYVNSQENILVQKSFRALTQIGNNFESRYKSYYSIVSSSDMKAMLEQCNKDFKQTANEITKYSFGIELIDKDKPEDNNYIYLRDSTGKISKPVKYFLSDTNRTCTSKEVNFRINKDDFFKPIERKDVFEEIIFIKVLPPSNTNEFFYSSFKGDLQVNKLDSIAMPDKGISSGGVSDVKISGIDYKLFLTKINLYNDEVYYVGGVINKDDYVKDTRSINSYLVLLILFIFITFLLSIPLFKIKMISENQQLKVADLLLSTLSIIIGTFFILLVILSVLGYNRSNSKINSQLTGLSESIKNSFIGEIKKIDRTLDLYAGHALIKGRLKSGGLKSVKLGDSTYIILKQPLIIGLDNFTRLKLNDSVHSDDKGLIITNSRNHAFINYRNVLYMRLHDTVYSKLENSDFIELNNQTYNYFKLIFKLNNEGWQSSIISSREKSSSSDNYSYRKYFIESGEWRLEGSRLMLDFVISSTSGEQLGVVSKRKGDTVYVITSRLNSVINTILPAGFGFCVIDSKGDVMLHSDSERMLRENFLEETRNSGNLLSAIYGNRKIHFSAKYLGKNHTCYIQPVSTLPLYLITFYDDSYNNSLNMQITSTTLIFLFFLLVLFLLQVILSRVVDYRKSGLKRNLDIIDWLRPADWKIIIYKKILLSNFLSVVLMVISYMLTNTGNTIFLIYLLVSIQVIAANFYTNKLTHELFGKKYLPGQILLSIFVLTFIFYMAVKTGADFPYLAMNGIISGLFNYLLITYKKPVFASSKSDYKIFYSYLLSWLFVIVIAPLIIFYTKLYNYETGLDTAHTLYSYAENIARRNYDIDKFYDDYMNKSFFGFKRTSQIAGDLLFKRHGQVI